MCFLLRFFIIASTSFFRIHSPHIISGILVCHDTNSKFKFWACNDVKYALDACFKKEKKVLLEELNKDYEKKRQAEEDAFQSAMGHSISFEEYLKKDADFIRATSTTR